MDLMVIPIHSKKKIGKFDLFETIIELLEPNLIKNGDILVISSKFISNSQGRLLDLECINSSTQAKKIAEKFQLKPKISEIIIRESDITHRSNSER